MVTLAGRPDATVGAVYKPELVLIAPQVPGFAGHNVALPKLHVTPVLLLALVTVAVNWAVSAGQLSAVSFG